MAKHIIATVEEIPSGDARSWRWAASLSASLTSGAPTTRSRTSCPHQGAPLCRGNVKGTTLPSKPGEYIWGRDGEIIRCPWHGWEFDILTGRSLFNPHRVRVKAYEVTVEPGEPAEGGGQDEAPSVETYPVTIEADRVVLHL